MFYFNGKYETKRREGSFLGELKLLGKEVSLGPLQRWKSLWAFEPGGKAFGLLKSFRNFGHSRATW